MAAESLQITELDRQVGCRAISLHWPNLAPGTPEYEDLLTKLASFHQIIGTEQFELRYYLRPPKNREEKWTLQFMNGEITEADLGARYKADAERPIDLEMLTEFHNAYSANVENYAGVLQPVRRSRARRTLHKS